ncbi:MAG: J domain-containing protein [Acidimicrobiales bacterium]|jgi:hypothetical protein|nr:J domain-containing protein [Acidimicrobiales bacterium]
MGTHYDVLGVRGDASVEEIRSAYLDLARRYHPDRLGSASPVDRARAEARMRRVNEAWDVLGDPAGRRTYDLLLADATSADGPTTAATGAGAAGGARSRPPHRSPDEMPRPVDLRPATGARHGPGPLTAFVPIVLILAVLVAILVITAYAGGGGDEGAGVDSAEPYPVGSCVAVVFSTAGAVDERGAQARPSIVPAPCSRPGASRVVARVPVPVSCPAGSVAQLIPDTEEALCLGVP